MCLSYFQDMNKNIFVIFLLFLLFALLFTAKLPNLFIDFGRETFFPQAVASGEVLYKDIFNIFGPFSYMFNALFYKIFGANLNVLYVLGNLNTLLILILTFLISRKFLPEAVSMCVTIVVLLCAYTFNIQNYITPYSYAMVYGLSAMLLSVYCFLNYFENKKKPWLYASFLFGGAAFANKYEYTLYFPVLVFFLFKNKENTKTIFYSLSAYFFLPALLFAILFTQGLNFQDLRQYFPLFFAYAKSPSLEYLYAPVIKFSLNYFLMNGIILALWAVIYSGVYFLLKKSEKLFLPIFIILFLICIVALPGNYSHLVFTFFPMFILVCALIKYKELEKNPALLFLTLSALVFSIKSFWIFTTSAYANFMTPLVLPCAFSLLFLFNSDKIFKKALCVILGVFCLYWFFYNFQNSKQRIYPFKTEKAYFVNDKSGTLIYKELYEYIIKNTKADDTVIMLPESAFINFLTGRKTDNYYNIFTPDRVEAYGEKRIISHYEKTKPDYFIIADIEQKPYGHGFICQTYAQELCAWIFDNYKPVKKIDKGLSLSIYKLSK